TDDAWDASIIPDDVKTAYETQTWPGASTLRSTVPLGGQKVAFATSGGPDDTAYAVQSLTFGMEVPAKATYNALGPKKVRFFPVVRTASIAVPALQRIAQTSAAAAVVFPHTYLVDGFGSQNPGQVFLAADPAAPKLGVAFTSKGDRSGGLVTPDMSLSGLSRLSGPVSGDLSLAVQGSFSAASWFGPIAGARLFGVLKLGDILDDV